MKKLLILAVVLLISVMLVYTIYLPAPVSAQTKYKVSGYILDSNGHGIAGANIIFNVPQIVPSYISTATGYYEMLAPAGTYHVNVWPPYDSNYISYDERNLAVNSDMAKNITLQSGCKVSGYVTDTSGAPVVGAVVFYGNYGSGHFTTSTGYYFLSVPAGTYRIDAHPRTGTYSGQTSQFPTYYENNVVVSGTLVKNIVVGATSTSTPTPTPVVEKYKVSGYVVDSTGKGIAGANIIFNVPSIVPSVYSDTSGYYQMYAPVGTYHVNVWPPYDSAYVNYDEANFNVNGNAAKNITLNSGCKVSGYILDANGAPIVGAVVLLNNYASGYFTTTSGYYFLSVPAGTYRVNVHPRTGTYSGQTSQFTTYIENNFQVNDSIVKNITISQQTSVSPTPTTQPNPTQSPTPQPTLPQTHITIQADTSAYNVGSALIVEGTLIDQEGKPLNDKTIILSYSVAGGSSWVEVGSAQTNSSGYYSIQWLIEASGTFILKATYPGNSIQQGAEDTTALSFLPYQDQKVFFVESNSTITGLDFNSQTLELGFIVSGSSGTKGHTDVTIATSLVSNFTGFTVTLDGQQIDYSVSHSDDYWVLSFDYSHSTHQVMVGFSSETRQNQVPIDTTILIAVSAIIIAIVIVGLFLRKRL